MVDPVPTTRRDWAFTLFAVIVMPLPEAGWSTDLAADEFRSLSPNVALLESIAKQTKGEVIAASQLDAFVRTLPNRQAPMMETWTQPAWHTPVLFGFALACLLAEWALRRWNGLP